MRTDTDGAVTPPRWDLGDLYPSPDSRAFLDATERAASSVDRLRALYDRHDIRDGVSRLPDDADIDALEEVLAATNDALEEIRTPSAYLHALVTTDARDDDAAAQQAALAQRTAAMSSLVGRLGAWLRRLGADDLAASSRVGAEHAFVLRRLADGAAHRLSDAEEELVSVMRLTGSVAWARLHRDLTARLEVRIALPAGERVVPMSVARGLASDPDAEVRRAAHEAELDTWRTVEVPLAAALNGAIGERVTLDARRGWADPLDAALFANAVDRTTLDAMHAAVTASLPDFRRYLRAKARCLGHDGGLPWWDLAAPVGDTASDIDWHDAVARVRAAFGAYGASLDTLARRAVDDRWIDAAPRDGKVGGAYCMSVRPGESRILLNFDASAGAVSTLAHELGHAYHNLQLAERTPLQRRTPMALAETASIFCETLLVDHALDTSAGDEQLALLDSDLQGATQVVVDIHSRFLFESTVCERRRTRTLGVAELRDLMVEAQDATYGNGLAPGSRHPSMWAVKSHYFTPFYNWPYTFGLLFGLGLVGRYREDPDGFRARYDDLLSATGMDDAASLGARFGVDVRDEEFWQASLDVVRDRIDRFVDLARPGGSNRP